MFLFVYASHPVLSGLARPVLDLRSRHVRMGNHLNLVLLAFVLEHELVDDRRLSLVLTAHLDVVNVGMGHSFWSPEERVQVRFVTVRS